MRIVRNTSPLDFTNISDINMYYAYFTKDHTDTGFKVLVCLNSLKQHSMYENDLVFAWLNPIGLVFNNVPVCMDFCSKFPTHFRTAKEAVQSEINKGNTVFECRNVKELKEYIDSL